MNRPDGGGIRRDKDLPKDWFRLASVSRRYPLAALTPGTLIAYQDRQRWTFPGISYVRTDRRLC
jgi:hypothetical protein